ncbi:MAG: acyl carrier protein [Xanthomonadales bacterium]|nr:acyl carrier protein [Xanthomonadales bacterium]
MSIDLSSTEARITDLLYASLEPRWSQNPQLRVEITAATRLQSDLTLDSFQIMEFLMDIEDEFDLAIDMSQLSDVHTVRDLAAVVDRHLA